MDPSTLQHQNEAMVQFICPQDGGALVAEDPTRYRCPQCYRHYPVEEGVLRLLSANDEFYEGAYDNQVHFLPSSEQPWHTWPLWLINSGFIWTVRRLVPAGATVIELGCAGGVGYFGRRYHMVGCDLSFSSLKKLPKYERRVQADAAICIPLPDNSVDAVVSSYFWEHISSSVKPAILSECRRILRPTGKIIFLYDVETENPLIRRYKTQDRNLYERLFIEGDGHLGYQPLVENLAMFEKAGFRVIRHTGMEKTWLQSPSVYDKLSKFDGMWRQWFKWAQRLGRQPLVYPYTALMRIVDAMLCPLLPENWARISLAVCEKKPT